jgi:hypothetical protein
MRHRKISLYASLQFIDELNVRLYKQADIVIQARDLAFSGWGRQNNLELGKVANLTWIDKSGIMTGHTFEESGQMFTCKFYGQRYWGNYSTEHDINIFRDKLKVKRPVVEISSGVEDTQKLSQAQGFYNTLAYFIYDKPGKRIKGPDFSTKLKEFGCDWSTNVWGTKMREIGAVKHYYAGTNHYDLAGVDLDDIMEKTEVEA